MKPESTLVFATCQPGAQSAMKMEVAGRYPAWRPAFSRPGFVSWRLPGAVGADLEPPSLFAHAFGLSSGCHRPDALEQVAQDWLREWGGGQKPCLHVSAREVSPTRETANPLEPVAREIDAALRSGGGFADSPVACPGSLVFDILVVDADTVLAGCHLHHNGHSPHPGGKAPLELPADAPSRAWLKIEEALLWHPRRLRPGDIVVEIGSAPGGTAFALANRGAEVICIDPAALVPGVKATHLRKPAQAVDSSELPPAFDWLLIDINDNPGSTLRIARRFAAWSRRRPSLILTLKTSDWSAAQEVPTHLATLRKLGYRDAFARQLWHGRREIVLFA